ncbi:MAG: fatty acid desaturase [Rhodobacteraceae bacterium]|nr:fatty acid desaturase [Paracoccaceae bacterium]MCY4141507.1 fatty acid desaturase [Paracoccaceae bacterium]
MDLSMEINGPGRKGTRVTPRVETAPRRDSAGSVITNAASTGIRIDRRRLKSLARRSDRPGLAYLAAWVGAMVATGSCIWLSLGTLYVWPAMFVFGVVMSVPSYSLSHETAHGTAFRTRWLNEMVFWTMSLLYGEEPLHRRYTHTNHHTYTWYVGRDSQMPFDTPLDFKGWLYDVSGLSVHVFQARVLWQLATKRYTDLMRDVAPDAELPKMTRNARIFSAAYLGIAVLIASGITWPLWFYVLPRLLGGPIMLMFNIIQHAELQENSPSIIESTRSFRTNWIGRFLYLNMNNHVEHHLYPQVPFYSLPELHREVVDQTPAPDPGFWRTNVDLFWVVARRSLGYGTKSAWIRQAPHMVTDGGAYEKIARATMQ